jgi:hypothetical protein
MVSNSTDPASTPPNPTPIDLDLVTQENNFALRGIPHRDPPAPRPPQFQTITASDDSTLDKSWQQTGDRTAELRTEKVIYLVWNDIPYPQFRQYLQHPEHAAAYTPNFRIVHEGHISAVKKDVGIWRRQTCKMIRRTVCAARYFYGEIELETAGVVQRNKLWKKLVDLAPWQVLSEFLGSARSVLDIQSICNGKTAALAEWREYFTDKFVRACEHMFRVLKDVPDRNVGQYEMEFWGMMWRRMPPAIMPDGSYWYEKWEHLTVESTPVMPA